MVKSLNLSFNDEEFVRLSAVKKVSGLGWKAFVLSSCLAGTYSPDNFDKVSEVVNDGE